MSLPISPPFHPMEAWSVDSIPDEPGDWQYEPKWDGFRCLAFGDGARIELQSKAGQPLGRYFPEVVDSLSRAEATRFVLDGELAVPVQGRFSFDDLLQRIHPAASRVRKLSRETPAVYVIFDLLVDERGKLLANEPLLRRRPALERFFSRALAARPDLKLSPATTEISAARAWFEGAGGDLDGIIAKRLDQPYAAGERHAMLKIKRLRTADCVVGGFRYAERARVVGSLLLGLYNQAGQLDHVGFCSGLKDAQRPDLTKRLEALRQPPGFTGRAPGGPSRWNTKRSTEWEPLRPELVIEVSYDHFTGGRFRHGTRLLRWRPDKAPQQCRLEQVTGAGRAPYELLAA